MPGCIGLELLSNPSCEYLLSENAKSVLGAWVVQFLYDRQFLEEVTPFH